MRTILFSLLVFVSLQVQAQEVVLAGAPAKVISIDQFGDRATTVDSSQPGLMITKDGESYFWASRGNKPLTVSHSGIYITYAATDGSGYVRTINETARDRFMQQSPDNIVGRYTWVEHFSTDLTSVTVYGQ